jgi:hypothetical protein
MHGRAKALPLKHLEGPPKANATKARAKELEDEG